MPKPLFVAGERIYHMGQLVDFAAAMSARERARLIRNLMGRYAAGTFAPWLCQQVPPGVRSRRATLEGELARYGDKPRPAWLVREVAMRDRRAALYADEPGPTPLTFDALRDGALDVAEDTPLIEALLCDLLDIDAETPVRGEFAGGDAWSDGPAASGLAGVTPAEDLHHAGVRDMTLDPVSNVPADTLAARRAACAMFPWYAADGMGGIEDWSRVVTCDAELQEVLLDIARARAGAEGVESPGELLSPETVHVANFGIDAAFDLGLGLYPNTRFVGHGNPNLRLTDPLWMRPREGITCDIARVKGLCFEGELTLEAPCRLAVRSGQLGPRVTVHAPDVSLTADGCDRPAPPAVRDADLDSALTKEDLV